MATHFPVETLQIRADASPEAVASSFPDGENATASTVARWPVSVATHSPVAASQIRAV